MRLFITISLLFSISSLSAQWITGANEVRKGNDHYEEENWTKAQESYQKSIEKGGSLEGVFNLGDAMYKQKKYQESAALFKRLAETAPDKEMKAKAYHNLGNSLVQAKQLKPGIEAYKNALRNDPSDEETRHNLKWAMNQLKKEEEKEDQQKDQDQDQNQDQNQDEKKDQQKQDQQKKEEQEKQDQQNQQQDQQQQQEQQQPEQRDQLSKEEAQRMLDALNNEEKNLQQKLKQKKGQQRKVTIEKDW